MAERGHLVDHEHGAQPARAVERAQRGDDDEAQPNAMCPHILGGQDYINRGRLFLELFRLEVIGFLEIVAHRFR
jgi:hypothetical protein